MSPAKRPADASLVVGGIPRADLLPPEIKASERARRQRRGLFALVGVIVVVVAAGYAGASLLAQNSANALSLANTQTSTIQKQQAQYSEVKKAEASIAAAKVARLAATRTEIDWPTEIGAIVAMLPSGSQLTALTTTSSTPTAPLDVPLSPLEGARIAEIQLTVQSSDITDTAAWIRDLSTLKGFVDATPTGLSTDDATNDITTTVTLHLNTDVYWKRFSSEAAK